MKIEKFEDILSWQKSKNLAVFVYNVLKSNKDYGFKDQMQRAVVSISNNIAEGYERRSNKEFKQFLYVAKGIVWGSSLNGVYWCRVGISKP